MAENVAAVTNQLIQINKDTNQQLQENQDAQKGFFNRLGAIFSKGTLTPTQQKEKDEKQEGVFAKLGNKFDGLSKSFTGFFRTENFKQIVDDYDVAISKAKISHFVNRNKSVQYWIALEPDSEF